MNVILDLDVVENMKKYHDRRGEDQKSVFALVLGEIVDYDTFHVKDVIYRFLIHNKLSEQKYSQFLDDEILPALENFKESHPTHFVLGGITTETELSDDILAFWNTIQKSLKSTVIINKRPEIIISLDLTLFDKQELTYNCKAYHGKKSYNSVIFNEIPLKFQSNVHYNQLKNKLYNRILKSNEIFGSTESNKSDCIDDQMNLLNNYLDVINDHLDKHDLSIDEFNQLDEIVTEIELYFKNDSNIDDVNKTIRRNNTLHTLSTLLETQINLTDKINKAYV